MRMRSVPDASSKKFPSSNLRRGSLLNTVALWLLPALVLAQVSVADDDLSDLSGGSDQPVVQVGAFADPANAERLVNDLQQSGHSSITRTSTDETGGTLTFVFAGPYSHQDAALSAQAAEAQPPQP